MSSHPRDGATQSYYTDQTGLASSTLVSNLQQLASGVNSVLRESQLLPTEESLGQLETTDENFHSYDLVRSLQSRIDAAIGPLVESQVDERALEDDGHHIVAQITEEVFSSQEYNQLYHTFVSDVRDTVDEMLSDESTLLGLSEGGGALLGSSHSSATHSTLAGSSASELSSVHQTGLMFMAPEQLQAIAHSLTPEQPLQVRLNVMQHLLQFPAGDLVTCDNWLALKAVVQEALVDPCSTLTDMTLKLVQRMFAARTALTTREAYLSLAEPLVASAQAAEGGVVSMGERGVVTLAMGLDPADEHCIQMLKRYRLLNYFQNEVPSYWVRYSERIVEDIVSCTFTLLSLSYCSPALLGPAHVISLLDPKAAWFRKWMHGQYSRMKVLQELKSRPAVLQNAVSHLMAFGIKPALDGRSHAVAGSEPGHYSERDLQYLNFVHSLCLLERLLLYRGGRELFPLHLPGREAKVTITDVLVHLLNLMYSLSSVTPTPPPLGTSSPASPPPNQHAFDPTHLIAHLLREVVAGNGTDILCNNVLISTLTDPLKCTMGSQPSPRVCAETLVLMADILAVLASTDPGRHQLLYGEGHPKWSTNKSAAVHTIAEFVVHSLSSGGSSVVPQVTSGWLFVCRQLYNTGEGLLALQPYALHQHIARALKMVAVGGQEGGESGGFSWEEALLDNLLNFAGTPKGLLLLQQTGLMARCSQYMDHRYKLKLQVSKCEKFGYGCMVTQVASTAAGILELINSGFVSMQVYDLWFLLDGGEGDHRLVAPRAHPLDPMDRGTHKAVINLLNILSSYPALYEVLNQATPTSATPQVAKPQDNSPSTIFELLDRLVLVDSNPKKMALLNYQEAHLFGLRILSVLVTCLDSFLYLESQYSILEALLALQRESIPEDRDFIIIDACSMERGRVLVSCYLLGGPSERKLPPHCLSLPTDSDPWPLFSSFPVPSVYQGEGGWCSSTVALEQGGCCKGLSLEEGGELYRLLSVGAKGSSQSDSSSEWLQRLRRVFCAQLQKFKVLPSDVIRQLLQRCVACQWEESRDRVFPIQSDAGQHAYESRAASSVDTLGAGMVVRYGQFLGALDSTGVHATNLVNLLVKVRAFFASQQHERKATKLSSLKGDYVGFDWFTASVFLLMKGAVETWAFLRQFSTLLSSAYMWMPRLHLSSHLPAELAYSGIHPPTAVTTHHVELILQSEVPLVYSAFKMSGYTPSQICQHWIRQCFWNFLDWSEVCLYLTICIVMGIDYQVYFCVAVLKYLERDILQHTQEQNLLVFLKEEALWGFHCAHWLDFMEQLELKFRTIVLTAMRQLS